MQVDTIEILPIGPGGQLFQICDGLLYGHLRIDDPVMMWDDVLERVTLHPEISAYLARWVGEHGVLIGTRHPPQLGWEDVQKDVYVARWV